MSARKPPASTPLSGAAEPVRADIIAAATRVFSERGYHAASMDQIAQAVGIRKPSLYHHVRRKEDLLFAIHEQLIDELLDETTRAVDAAESPADAVRGVLRVALGFVARHRDAVTVFLQERSAVTGERWTELVVKRDRYEQMVSGAIADGVAGGRFQAVPPAMAARAVLAMANWGYTWFDPSGTMTSDEVAELFADIALKGLEVRQH
ncbi:MAG: TetR/AcrR family transcriptional regulator [Solirubrobacterales bacterium]|nr:TetR/AcrR family transcriptional regulator [Solirubrobacterales bacterium]